MVYLWFFVALVVLYFKKFYDKKIKFYRNDRLAFAVSNGDAIVISKENYKSIRFCKRSGNRIYLGDRSCNPHTYLDRMVKDGYEVTPELSIDDMHTVYKTDDNFLMLSNEMNNELVWFLFDNDFNYLKSGTVNDNLSIDSRNRLLDSLGLEVESLKVYDFDWFFKKVNSPVKEN